MPRLSKSLADFRRGLPIFVPPAREPDFSPKRPAPRRLVRGAAASPASASCRLLLAMTAARLDPPLTELDPALAEGQRCAYRTLEGASTCG
jgi:hypothetical protein